MRIRTFTGRTMREAMDRVRAELGDDAVIIATDETKRGVEIRAAIERETPEEVAFVPDESNLEGALLAGLSGDAALGAFEAGEIAARLAFHNVPGALARAISDAAAASGTADAAAALGAGIEKHIAFAPLPVAPRRPLILVGPPASGKTALVAKLAARAVLLGETVSLASADTARAGALAQIEAFATALSVTLTPTPDAAAMKRVTADPARVGALFIDAPGVSPYDAAAIAMLRTLIDAAGAEPVLALPAGLDADESAEMAAAFARLGVRKMIVTRADAARRLGGILAAAHSGPLALAHVSATPYVANGLEPLNGLKLARLLLKPLAVTLEDAA